MTPNLYRKEKQMTEEKKETSVRYGIRIKKDLACEIERYVNIVNSEGWTKINAQDVIRKALKEFLEKHLK
jgi:hypothetical protein